MIPFPNDEATPPVVKIYFVSAMMISMYDLIGQYEYKQITSDYIVSDITLNQ
jgi:hypothetical protein